MNEPFTIRAGRDIFAKGDVILTKRGRVRVAGVKARRPEFVDYVVVPVVEELPLAWYTRWRIHLKALRMRWLRF